MALRNCIVLNLVVRKKGIWLQPGLQGDLVTPAKLTLVPEKGARSLLLLVHSPREDGRLDNGMAICVNKRRGHWLFTDKGPFLVEELR